MTPPGDGTSRAEGRPVLGRISEGGEPMSTTSTRGGRFPAARSSRTGAASCRTDPDRATHDHQVGRTSGPPHLSSFSPDSSTEPACPAGDQHRHRHVVGPARLRGPAVIRRRRHGELQFEVGFGRVNGCMPLDHSVTTAPAPAGSVSVPARGSSPAWSARRIIAQRVRVGAQNARPEKQDPLHARHHRHLPARCRSPVARRLVRRRSTSASRSHPAARTTSTPC